MRAIGNNFGVRIDGGARFNRIGTDPANSVLVAVGRNVISGNRHDGILLAADGTYGNTVTGNLVGTDVAGTAALGNAWSGVSIDGASNNRIGLPAHGNTIAHNGIHGVVVLSGNGNALDANVIFSNAGLGIDLAPIGRTPNDPGDADIGPNGLQNYPVISSATTGDGYTQVIGSIEGSPQAHSLLQLFASPAAIPPEQAQGEWLLASEKVFVNSDGSGTFVVHVPFTLPPGTLLTATATDIRSGNTSEFSAGLRVNSMPVATDDSAVTNRNTRVEVKVLGNDIDADGDPLAIVINWPPDHGTAVLNDNGTPADPRDDFVVYTPAAGFQGTDSFIYAVLDGRGGYATAQVRLSVHASNKAPILPVIANQTMTAFQGNLTLALNGTDADGDTLRYTASVGRGSVPASVLVDGNQLRISSPPGRVGSFPVTVTVTDGVATVRRTFTVNVKNRAPVVLTIPNQTMTAYQSSLTLPVRATDTDGDTLRYTASIGRSSVAASVWGDGSDLIITSPPGAVGTFPVIVQVTDGLATARRTFTVKVIPSLTPDQFEQQINRIDAEQPLPVSGYPLDWTSYSGESGPYADDAVFQIAAWYIGKPGMNALSLATLPPDGVEASATLRVRAAARVAVLDPEIAGIAAQLDRQRNTASGVATYQLLRAKIVEQLTVGQMELDLAALQSGRDEEARRVQGARDLALRSLSPAPPAAEETASLDEQLAVVRDQLSVVISNLGTLTFGRQTLLDIAASATFRSTIAEATVAAQELGAAINTAHTAVAALQAREAELQELLAHPLDHVAWQAASEVDFAAGMLTGVFSRFAVSSPERELITVSGSTFEVRDTLTGSVLHSLTLSNDIISVASTSDQRVWTQTADHTIALRDHATGDVLWQEGNSGKALLTATTDGSMVATARSNSVILLRRSGAVVTRSDTLLTDSIQSGLRFDPSGTYLAVPMQATLVLLHLGSGSTYQFTGFRDWVNGIAWSPDGTLLVAADGKGFVQLFDVPTKQKIGSLQMPSGNSYPGAIAFSPNQALIATGDPGAGLMFWDITQPEQIREYARSSGKTDISFFQPSLTGNTLLARAGDAIVAYSIPAAGRGAPISRTDPPILDPVLPTPPPSPDRPAWSQNDKVPGTLGTLESQPFSSVTRDGLNFVIPKYGTIEIRSIATGQVTQSFAISGDNQYAALTDDGEQLIAMSNGEKSSAITLRDTATGQMHSMTVFPSLMMGVSVNPGKLLGAVVDQRSGSRAQIIELTTGQVQEIVGTEDHSGALAISESGRYVAVGLNDGTIVVYDRQLSEHRTLSALRRRVTALAWSHGSDTLLAAADDNASVGLFSPKASQALTLYTSPTDSSATTSLQFSANNMLLFRQTKTNGLTCLDVSNVGSLQLSSEFRPYPLNGDRPLALAASGQTLFVSAFRSDSVDSSIITAITIPSVGNKSVSLGPTPSLGPDYAAPFQSSAQQNELAAQTTISDFNATQKQYLLDTVTVYFELRVREGGTVGVPSFYLQSLQLNPTILGLGMTSSYREFYERLITDMRAKWPLRSIPVLDPFAGGSGNYVPTPTPIPPPTPSPVQARQRHTVEQMILSKLRSPVRLGAGQWVSVKNIDPGLSTHVGAELHAVDLTLPSDSHNTNPEFDKGQPVYAPMDGLVKRVNRTQGQLVIEHRIVQPDGSELTLTSVMFHLKVADAVFAGQHLRQGAVVGRIWNLTDGTIQANGETTVDSHLHFSVHLGGEASPSLDLTGWLAQERIGVLYTSGIDTGTEGGARLAPAFKATVAVQSVFDELNKATAGGSTVISASYALNPTRFTSITTGPISIAKRVTDIIASIPSELQRDLFDPLQGVLAGARDYLKSKARIESQIVLSSTSTAADRALHFTLFGLYTSLQTLVEGIQQVTPRSPQEVVLMAATGELAPVVAKGLGFVLVYGKKSAANFMRGLAEALQRGGAAGANTFLEKSQLALRQSGRTGAEQARALSAIERELFVFKKPEYRSTLDLVLFEEVERGHGLLKHISSGNVLSDQKALLLRLLEKADLEHASLFKNRETALKVVENVVNDYWKSQILSWGAIANKGATQGWNFVGDGVTELGSIMSRSTLRMTPGYNGRVVFIKTGPNPYDIKVYTYYVY